MWRNHSKEHQSKAGKAGYASLVAKGKEGLASKKAAEYRLKNPTELERQVIKWLTELDIPFKREVSIGKFYADFLIGKLVVEVNGRQWHKLEDLRQGQKERDKGKYRAFSELGYTVMVLPESDIVSGEAKNILEKLLDKEKRWISNF